MIQYHCICGTFYELNDDHSGKAVECYKCGHTGIAGEKLSSSHQRPKSSQIYTLEPPLTRIADLFTQTWGIYKSRFPVLLGILLIGTLSSLVILFGLVGLGNILSAMIPFLHGMILLISTALGIVGSLYVFATSQSAFFEAIINRKFGIKTAFKNASPKTISFIWVGILMAFTITGGQLLLLIPGIIFTVWFSFTPFVLMTENIKGMNALMKSRAYIQGRWFSVALRLLTIWLASFIVFLVPFFGTLLEFIFIPFVFIYSYLLFENLRSTRINMKFMPTTKAKAGILATATSGYLFLCIVLVLVFSMFLMKIYHSIKKQADINGIQSVLIQQRNAVFQNFKSWLFLSPEETSIKERFEEDLDTLEDPTKDIISERWSAAKRLEQTKDPRIVEPFIRLLESNAENLLREQAAKVLGSIGDERAIEPLKKALLDESFAMVITPDGTMTKIKLVSDAASIALRKMNVADVPMSSYTELLIGELKNKNKDVRLKAISILEKRGDPSSIEPLKKLLNNRDKDIAKSARQALKTIEKK